LDINEGERKRYQRILKIVVGYPFALLIIAIALNIFVWGVKPLIISLPTIEFIRALIIATALLIINHSWLMTATEIVRSRYKVFSTPEEWATNKVKLEDASEEGIRELKRCHDTHLNNTENIIYYVLLCIIFILCSPPTLVADILIIGYAASRIGYTYSFLYGKDGARGLFMSLSLLAMYCMACYLVIGLLTSN